MGNLVFIMPILFINVNNGKASVIGGIILIKRTNISIQVVNLTPKLLLDKTYAPGTPTKSDIKTAILVTKSEFSVICKNSYSLKSSLKFENDKV